MQNRYWSNVFTFITTMMLFLMSNIAVRLHFRDGGELFSIFTVIHGAMMGMCITIVKELLVQKKGGK